MKHLYIHLNKDKAFNKINDELAKLQVDNSLELGIPLDDIVFVTNFRFDYKGVNNVILGDHAMCFKPASTKTTAIFEMFRLGMIDTLYWVKDLDTYQVRPAEVNLEGVDLGITTYGWDDKWNMGSFFMTPNSWDIMERVYGGIYYHRETEEDSLRRLLIEQPKYVSRTKKLSSAYNVGMRGFEWDIDAIKEPLALLHFPPKFTDRMKPHLTDYLFKRLTHISSIVL